MAMTLIEKQVIEQQYAAGKITFAKKHQLLAPFYDKN